MFNKVRTFALLMFMQTAMPALAQNTFTVHNSGHLSGQGRLESGDSMSNDGRFIDGWPVYVETGERLSAVIETSDFNPIIWIEWTDNNGETQSLMQNVDTSSQPGRAQVDFTVEQADELRVFVTSQKPTDAPAAYSLNFSYAALPTFAKAEDGSLVTSGTITDFDYTLDNGLPFDPFVFSSHEGSEIEIKVESADFNPAVLVFYEKDNGELELLGRNDDANETTTNSAMQITVPKDGEFLVVVQGLEGSARGSYNINVRDFNYISEGTQDPSYDDDNIEKRMQGSQAFSDDDNIEKRMQGSQAFSDYMYQHESSFIMDMNSAFYGL